MIQAPQLQPYVPQQYAPPINQRNGAYTPVQQSQAPQNYFMPGTIYNYPATSSYLPVQSNGQQSRFNGVNIEIINPQGQGNANGGMPAQNAMNNYPYYANDGNRYNGVNIEILNPQGQGGNNPMMQNAANIPPQNVMPAQFYPAQQPQLMFPPNYPIPPQNIQPGNVNTQPVAVTPSAPPVVPSPVITPQQNVAAPVIDQPARVTSDVNPETFAGRLKSEDLDYQRAAIEDIAEKVKNSGADGPVLLDTQIFDSLVDIINKDTSSLAGPTPEIIELRNRNPEELTTEERNKTETTPLEKAEMNKLYSLYTISYMQNRLNSELEQRRGTALELKDLPCIDTIVDTAKSNPNPMLRVGAISSLAHIARPEYTQDLKIIFGLAQNDEDARVREAATDADRNLTQA